MVDKQLLLKHQSMLDQITRRCGSVAGKRVLELGSDSRGDMASSLRNLLDVREVIGVNPVLRTPIIGEGWQILDVDARSLPFEEESFDIVVSVAAFEHFQGLPLALHQAHRVLRPGGLLFSNFGPIWSSCWGHHLWIQGGGVDYTFLNTNVPPYGHLLMSREEMLQWWRRRYTSELADKAVAFMFDSEEQNRLFFDQYENIFQNSEFDVELFAGGTNTKRRADYDRDELKQALQAVRSRYPTSNGFEYDAITVLLKKN